MSARARIRRRRRRGWVERILWGIRIVAIVVLTWGVTGTVVQGMSGDGPTGEA